MNTFSYLFLSYLSITQPPIIPSPIPPNQLNKTRYHPHGPYFHITKGRYNSRLRPNRRLITLQDDYRITDKG